MADKNFKLETEFDNYLVYKNLLYKNPDYLVYKPNFVRARVPGGKTELEIPEIYSGSWKAYLNGTEKAEVFETKDKTRLVKIKEDTEFVDFKYQPWQ